jgi:Zn-dependent protease
VLRRAWRRFVALAASVGALLAKFGALLLKLKYVTLVLSMLVSIAAYTWLFGWTFAVGFVLLILVHELGHVLMLKRQGIPASLPVFIPFMGAFVSMRAMPRTAYQEAQSGLAGPAFGTAAALVVEMWGRATGSLFLTSLASVGFLLNLFNLLPALPLDGGRAAAALHPALWLAGLIVIVGLEVVEPSPVLTVLLVLGGYELWQRWRHRGSRAAVAYHALLPAQRAAIAVAYVAVLAVAIIGFHTSYIARSF